MENPVTNTNFVNLRTLDTTGPHPTYDLLDTDAKRLLRATIKDSLTPEIRQQCDGLKVLVLSCDEYDLMMLALRERGERRQLEQLRHQ